MTFNLKEMEKLIFFKPIDSKPEVLPQNQFFPPLEKCSHSTETSSEVSEFGLARILSITANLLADFRLAWLQPSETTNIQSHITAQ
jgi:hypothetical protein